MYPGYFSDLWDAMHVTARDLPRGTLSQTLRDGFRNDIEGQCSTVPCPSCKSHAHTYLVQHPLDPKTGQEAFEWTVDFHNHVNVQNGKPKLTYEEAEKALIERTVGMYKNKPQSECIQTECMHKLKDLQQRATQLRSAPFAVSNQTMYPYVVVTMVFAAIALLLLIGLMIIGGNISRNVKQYTSLRS